MVIAIQWPDRYRPVLSLQGVFTAVKWPLTCSASEQRTLLWALSAVCTGETTFCLKELNVVAFTGGSWLARTDR